MESTRLAAGRLAIALVCLCTGAGSNAVMAQALPEPAVLRLDASLDAIVSPDAQVEVLKSDYFGMSEGPTWVREGAGGYLLFSDIAANAIYKWTSEGELSVFLAKSGFTGTDASQVGAQLDNGRLTVILIGSNGLTVDPQGRLLVVAMGDRRIIRIEKNGARTILADRYDGRRINGGNDIVSRANGAVYFTDGTGGLRGRDKSPAKELPYDAVYLIKNGRLTLLAENPQDETPNGIALSPDERHLYVNSGGRFITRYDVRADDTIGDGMLFLELNGDMPGGADGMKVDTLGNLYCTGPGGVWIISPAGRHLGTIRIPEPAATNMAFGDPDGKSLYITNRRSLLRIRLNTPGIIPGPQ